MDTNKQNEKILDVRDLSISFRTPGGLVKAVRGLSYHLNRGETLAIVGESGSGKSVTSRALLGISAGNAVVESGEIIFDGQDLLRISEDDFHKIRGEKISMIFQDPLSSLNPIVKIGKQLTEAMIIKGKSRQKNARKEFNERLSLIRKYMDKSDRAKANLPPKKELPAILTKWEWSKSIAELFQKLTPEEKANKERIQKFDKFEYTHTQLEGAYNLAKESVDEAIDEIDYLLLLIEKDAVKNLDQTCREIKRLADKAENRYVVEDGARLKALTTKLVTDAVADKNALSKVLGLFSKPKPPSKEVCTSLLPTLKELKELLSSTLGKPEPSFFSMGYYLTFANQPLPEMEVAELNEFLKQYLRENFMNDFIAAAEKALAFAFNESLEQKKKVIEEISAFRDFLQASFDEKEILKKAEHLFRMVEKSINRLTLVKDSVAYTFRSSMTAAIKNYFVADRGNKKESAKFEKSQQKYNELKAAGKTPSFEPKEPSLIEMDGVREVCYLILRRLEEKYKADIESADKFDVQVQTRQTVGWLRTKAAAVVYKVTKKMAKLKALKIMEEVGIPEPRRRFNQYPFEFSGGMRQRIVIAIALTANPEILVCDEPTTALDVTIQAQILELINDLKKKHNLSVIFITHDLGVVANMADRIAVMYAGKIVEHGTAEDVFYNPAHPYTWALLSSMPDLETTEKLDAIPGTPPNMLFPPKGDAFAARNKYAMKIDFEEQPPMFKISDTHYAATWLLHPDAPEVKVPKIVTERIKRNKKLVAELDEGGEQQ